ncbi:MAG: cellulase family glycosylhydrolase [Bacteroidales bacterium]
MKKYIIAYTVTFYFMLTGNVVFCQGFLKAEGKQIVNEKGENVLLRGIGLGGWMLQEPYMFQLSEVAGNQTDIKSKISGLIGQKSCDEFYMRFLTNMITEKDIEALKKWGFNSLRLPMHYNLFTLPVEKEPVAGQNTWLETGFKLTDNLLSWCRKYSIYLILDLHAAPGGQGNDRPIADIDTLKPRLWESEANQNKTVALWKKLAGRYKDEEWIGGYDLINETNYKLEGNAALKKLFSKITGEIRKIDKKHIIFIEGNQFANDYTGLTPPWDNNMIYSFHKYWNPNTLESIQKYLDMREKYDVPLWMGESGENTTEWFKAAVNLFETNNIGWSWWTIKKIGSENSLMTISKPAGYQKITDYWLGKGPKPTVEEATKTLLELAENVKFEKCKINTGVLEALFGKK